MCAGGTTAPLSSESNLSSFAYSNSDTPPELCSTWNDTAKPNTSPGYGPIIAYPAHHLKASCYNSTIQQEDNFYSCKLDPETGLLVIDNFWSTNALKPNASSALSLVQLDVVALDAMNQTVTVGEAHVPVDILFQI